MVLCVEEGLQKKVLIENIIGAGKTYLFPDFRKKKKLNFKI